ncbi:MAG: sulfite exporter TauE/SafE family protein, partial [Roseinatronobacter sp.]
MTDLSLMTLLPFMLGLVATGAVAGILSGLLGVGGGIVTVPVLFWVFKALGYPPGLGMQVAVGTSLLAVAATAYSSAKAHHSRGSVDLVILRRWSPWMILGAACGGAVAGLVTGTVLLLIFGCIALLVAWNMAQPVSRVLGPGLPEGRGVQPAIASGVAFISSMMGIGSGTLGVPVMTAFSVPVHRAVGTAAGLGLMVGAPGAVAMLIFGIGVADRPPLSVGFINLPAIVLILPLSILCAPMGARLAHAMSPVW